MKVYVATRNPFGVTTVKVYGDPTLKRPWFLRPRLDLRHYCPDPFDWGYAGPAAAQLSIAILADHFDHQDDERAVELHESFLREIVRHLPTEGWELSAEEIDQFLVEEQVGRREEGREDPPAHT